MRSLTSCVLSIAIPLALLSSGCHIGPDDPNRNLDPLVPEHCPDPDNPLVDYVSQDPDICAETEWMGCHLYSGMTYIPDECGCGCLCPDPDDPAVHYVGESSMECMAMDIACDPGQRIFTNGCGCGCLDVDVVCPDSDDPTVRYLSSDPDECSLVGAHCDLDAGQTYVPSECGCGCLCPEPSDPRVHYVEESFLDPGICIAVDFGCEEGQRLFSGLCGCGCYDIEEPTGSDPACPDPDDPLVDYVSQDPEVCAGTEWMGCHLDSGMTYIPDECGCGCLCPDPDDPAVHYVEMNHLSCADMDIACDPGQRIFSNGCGCGCLDEG